MNRKQPVDAKQLDLAQNWENWRNQIKLQYPDLTDEDLLYEIEKEEELLTRLEAKTGKTKEEIYDWLHLMG